MINGFVVLKVEILLIAKIYLAIINVKKFYWITLQIIRLNKRLGLAQFHLVEARKIFVNLPDRASQ